jgi:DNA-binding CsgD family transcriptional regulator
MRRAAEALRQNGRILEAARRLHADAEALAERNPREASALLRDAALAAGSVDEWTYARVLAERSRTTSSLAGSVDPLADALATAVEAQLGRPVSVEAPAPAPRSCVEEWEAVLSVAQWTAETASDLQPWLALIDSAVREAERTEDDRLRLRALLARGPLLALEFGASEQARSDLLAAVGLARSLGDPMLEGAAVFSLAGEDAISGNEQRCRERIARVAELWKHALEPRRPTFQRLVLGNLELALGRPERAIRELEPVVGALQAPSTPAHATLVEAYVRAGRRDDARRLAARLVRTSRRRSTAAVERARALVAPPGDAEERYATLLGRQLPPYVRARTHLDYGERLRRAKRRRAAREHLHAALEEFDRLGAYPWADRARGELAASGIRRTNGSGELTAQEHRVARLVAEGATNDETAVALFITENTVEFHLKNVYRKLDVRSRTELARRMGR